MLNQYDALDANLGSLRQKQFYDDAYKFLGVIKAASDKNTVALSTFLREFAEYILLQTTNSDEIASRADEIPPMNESMYD